MIVGGRGLGRLSYKKVLASSRMFGCGDGGGGCRNWARERVDCTPYVYLSLTFSLPCGERAVIRRAWAGRGCMQAESLLEVWQAWHCALESVILVCGPHTMNMAEKQRRRACSMMVCYCVCCPEDFVCSPACYLERRLHFDYDSNNSRCFSNIL